MHIHIIPPEEWIIFCDKFSRDHEGWAATIEVMEGFERQMLAKHLAFHGISLDTKGSRPAALQISAGGVNNPHLDHTVDLPLQIREVLDHNGGVHLQIEPARGAPTIIHLRAPVQ